MFANTRPAVASSYVRHPRNYANRKSINNVRFNWFVLGSLFGLFTSVLLDMGAARVMEVAVMEPAETPAALTTSVTVADAHVPAARAEEVKQKVEVAISDEKTETANTAPSFTVSALVDESLELARDVTKPAESWVSGLFTSSTPEQTEKTPAPEPVAVVQTLDTNAIGKLARAARKEALPRFPQTLTLKVGEGDTMLNILTDAGVAYDEAMGAVTAMKPKYDPRKIRVGQELEVSLTAIEDASQAPSIDSVSVALNTIDSVVLERKGNDGFTVSKQQKALTPKVTYAGGTIKNSFFETGYANGVPNGVLAEMMKAYSYDVDFQREIQRGDKMEVLFEKMTTEDGDTAGYGKIFFAELVLRGKAIPIYRHEDKSGFSGYYNEKGESIVKALLKTPVDGARISSNYGMRRHPILGYSKMHAGTDFAARTGTPIYAAGDGTVVFKGRKGGYGNYIQIKHNGTYQTAYAHMSRFGKGMRNGKKVKQGQVIGYVGSTGRSTGPHLHYEVIKNGKKVNPMGQQFKAGRQLRGTELANFKREVGRIKTKIAGLQKDDSTKLASAE